MENIDTSALVPCTADSRTGSAHHKNFICRDDPSGGIISWLLSEAQVQNGPQRGGVVGWYDFQQAGFVYGEITGYYLTFLAYLATSGNSEGLVRDRIRSAAVWIERSGHKDSSPLTRTYLDGREDGDWRNQFHFSFDIAMMLRGVASVADFLNGELRDSVLQCLGDRLSGLLDRDGSLPACVAIRGGVPPARWSTAAGAYQLKAAVPILELGPRLPSKLHSAASRMVVRWTEYSPEPPGLDDLHPFLYYIEGLVILGAQRSDTTLLQRASSVFCEAFGPGRRAEQLPNMLNPRSDVLAQTLRLSSALKGLGYLHGQHWDDFMSLLVSRLLSFCGPEGAVYFRRASSGNLIYANIWSSIFTAQALEFYRLARQGGIDPTVIRLLV